MLINAPTYPVPPYEIPSLPKLEPATIKNLDRREIRRFLRIEGLLRSQEVWDLYKQAVQRTSRRRVAPPILNIELWCFLYGGNRLKLRGNADAWIRRLLWDDSLRERFHVDDGWAVLLGSHHRYLYPRDIPFRIGGGIADLAILHKSPDLSFKLKYLKEKQSRYLYLMIDSLEVSSSDLTALKHLLTKRQKTYSAGTVLQKSPPIKDVSAWLKYLQCHDLHRYKKASASEVSRSIYEAPEGRFLNDRDRKRKKSARRQVIRACRNVEYLIKQAVKGPWLASSL